MADNVQKILERSIPELEDLQERGLFNEHEIRSITNKRRDYEYRLQRRGKTLEDFLRYIEYEKSIDKLRILRKERMKLQKNTLSDFSCTRRVQFIFDRALQRFQQNISLWLMCIDHAIATKSGKRIGRLFPKALRLHPLNISLWVKAAEWECNGNQSFDTARILLTRGLRLNKGNPTLYRELFELELSFASIIKERRRILGLDNSAAETSVENEAISETKLSIPQLPGEDDDYDAGNGTKSNNKNKIQEDGKIKMIQGRMATIVFNNAIQKIQDSNECIQFALDCLNISATFYNDIPNVTDHLLNLFEKDAKFNNNEECWEARAKWFLQKTDDNNSEEKEEDDDDDDDDNDNNKKRSRSNNIYEIDVMTKEKIITIYKKALSVLPTVKMYDYYLKFMLSYGKGKEIEDCFYLLENEDKITLDQYGEWIRISSRFHDIDGKKDNSRKAKRNKVSKKDNVKTKSGLKAIDIAQKCVDNYPKEATSWLYLIDVMLHNLQYDSSPIALNYIEEKFQQAVSKMLPKSKNSLNVELKWMQYKDAMKNTLSEVSDHIITRLRNGNLEDTNKIVLAQNFIDLIIENKEEKNLLYKFINEIISKNDNVNAIFLVCPWEIFKIAIYTEMTVNGLNANVGFIRKLFESAIVNGANNEEMWLDYIRFESQKPGDVSKVTNITWRAKQNLTNKDEFEENLSKMQAGLL